MSYFDHHNLIYFQKAKQGTKEIVLLFSHLPGNKTSEVLYKQILRSSSSIGANIAEGYGRNSKKEVIKLLTTTIKNLGLKS